MATADMSLSGAGDLAAQAVSHSPAAPPLEADSSQGTALHRVREVRLEQGLSLRSAARQMDSDVRTLRKQEQPTSDLRLSDLHKWQSALEVPLVDLIEDGDHALSRPVMERARMVRLMKTAMAIREQADDEQLSLMAEMMVQQLTEIMPELADVSAWHSFGQRRSLDEYGRVVERRISEQALSGLED